MSAESLLANGKKYLNANNLDSAMICYSLAQNKTSRYSNDIEKEHYLKALNGIGVVSFLYGNYSRSYIMFSEAIDVDSTFTDSNMNIASLYLLFGERGKAKKHLIHAYNDYLKNGNQRDMAATLTNLINLGILYDDLDDLNNLLNRFLKSRFDNPELSLKYVTYLAAGAKSIINDNYNGAISKFDKALLLTDSLFIGEREKAAIYANIAKCWEKAGELDSAILYNKKALSIGMKLDYADYAVKAGKAVADLYDKAGKSDSSMRYRLNAFILEDSLHTFLEFNNIKGFELQKQTEKFQSSLSKLSSEKRERNIIIIFSWTIIAILALSLLLIRSKNKKLKKKDRVIFSALNQDDFKTEDAELSRGSARNISTESSGENGCRPTPIISDEYARQLMARIIDVLENNTNYLSKEKFTIADLAGAVNDRVKNVSYVINILIGKNFNAFINEYRIKACVKQLKENKKYRSYTVEHIASDFGFKSRSNFSKVFNSVIGMSPTSWLEIIREKDSEK